MRRRVGSAQLAETWGRLVTPKSAAQLQPPPGMYAWFDCSVASSLSLSSGNLSSWANIAPTGTKHIYAEAFADGGHALLHPVNRAWGGGALSGVNVIDCQSTRYGCHYYDDVNGYISAAMMYDATRTIFFCIDNDDAINPAGLFGINNQSYAGIIFMIYNNAARIYNQAGSQVFAGSAILPNSGKMVVGFRVGPGSACATWQNGTLDTGTYTDPGDPGSPGFDRIPYLFNAAYFSDWWRANMGVAEVVWYDTTLSDADTTAVGRYLMTKWGVS